jgi:glycosyltransferase involved in cell wall biosynthesis
MVMFCAYSFAFEEQVFSFGPNDDLVINASLVLIVSYVITGVAGWCCTYVFNVLAYSEMADAIEKLVRDAQLRKIMGEAGKARANQYFSLERMLKDHTDLYRSL